MAGTLACRAAESSVQASIQETIGDTLVVTSYVAPPAIRVNDIRTLWQSPDIEDPDWMLVHGGQLIITDGDRFHVVEIDGGSYRTLGRRGEGPGEFRSIQGIGIAPGDSVVVLDGGLRRVSVYTPDLRFARAQQLSWPFPYVEVRRWNGSLVAEAGGYALVSTSRMDSREEISTRAALTWHDPQADSALALQVIDDLRYMSIDLRTLSSRRLFPRSPPPLALSSTLDLAWGDGMQYCVNVAHHSVSRRRPSPHVTKMCRDWQAPALGDGIRNPDFSELSIPPDMRRSLNRIHEMQTIPDRMPSFDQIQFDQQGRLWVRTVGEELANIHPRMLLSFPERGPTHRAWDIFAQNGRLLATISLPRTFDPRIVLGDRVIGLVELSTGEMAIGEAVVPEALLADISTSPSDG